MVLEKTLESPLDCRDIQPVHPKGNQSWIFIGKTDTETLILWPPDVKNLLIWKDPDARKKWRQEEKGMTEDEMVSPTQWTWVWVNSRSWWWTERPDVLQAMGLWRVRQDWATEQPPPPPMVRTQHSHSTGWILGGETKIPAAANCGKKKSIQFKVTHLASYWVRN